MKRLLFLVAIIYSISTAAAATASAGLPYAAERDVQCLTLVLVGISMNNDHTKQQAMIAESWYFVGRLGAEAPGLDLNPAINGALKAMNGNPRAKEIGSACDAEFEKRGADLRSLGG